MNFVLKKKKQKNKSRGLYRFNTHWRLLYLQSVNEMVVQSVNEKNKINTNAYKIDVKKIPCRIAAVKFFFW